MVGLLTAPILMILVDNCSRLYKYIPSFFMTIETTVFTFKISNTFDEWVKMFDSAETTDFHKKVGLTPLYRGKSLFNPIEVIVIHQAE